MATRFLGLCPRWRPTPRNVTRPRSGYTTQCDTTAVRSPSALVNSAARARPGLPILGFDPGMLGHSNRADLNVNLRPPSTNSAPLPYRTRPGGFVASRNDLLVPLLQPAPGQCPITRLAELVLRYTDCVDASLLRMLELRIARRTVLNGSVRDVNFIQTQQPDPRRPFYPRGHESTCSSATPGRRDVSTTLINL